MASAVAHATHKDPKAPAELAAASALDGAPAQAPGVRPAAHPAPYSTAILLTDQIAWHSMPNSALHAYRHAHRLAAPPAYASAHHQLILADPAGLGRLSPTVAGCAKGARRAPKEALAQAVRRHCNAAPVNDTEAITALLYAVKNQSAYSSGQQRDGKNADEWTREGLSCALRNDERQVMTPTATVYSHVQAMMGFNGTLAPLNKEGLLRRLRRAVEWLSSRSTA